MSDKILHVAPTHRQRPLMMQLALASGAIAQPTLSSSKRVGNDFWVKEGGKQARASMEKVVEGLRKYQLHPYERPLQMRSIVWSDGEARLCWFAPKLKARQRKPKASILLIPSMINGPEIFDMLPEERSLISWLTDQGIEVFLLEWGNLRNDPELASFDLALGKKLTRALDWLRTEQPDINLFGLGYCMGGLFLAAAEILRPHVFDGLIFVATPWNFKAGAKGNFAQALSSWAADGLRRVVHLDYMPAEWLQMIFAGVDPSLVARKFSAFADMKEGGLEEKLFVGVEDWVNGGSDLPSGIVQQAVRDWYLANMPHKGTWTVASHKIDPKKIKKPTLVIVPSKDKIVPPESAIPLAYKIPDADLLEPDCGHISMMVSSRAKSDVWEPMAGWIFDITTQTGQQKE